MILRDDAGPEQGWSALPSQAPRPPAAPEPGRRRRWAKAGNPRLVNVIASIDSPSSPGVDLSARLAHLPRTLEADARRAEVLAEIVRQAHETLEPRKVAEWLVGRLQAWVPLASWTVLEDDLMGPPRALAGGPLEAEALAMVASVASRAIRLGEELVTANLKDHLVSAPPVAALGLPLVARGAVIGAVVGLAAERRLHSAGLRRRHAPRPRPAARSGRRRARQRPPHGAGRGAVGHGRPDPAVQARFLKQALTRELKRSVRSGRPLSVIFLDLDGFKGVNDRTATCGAAARWWSLRVSFARAPAKPTSSPATAVTSSRWSCPKPTIGAQTLAERIRARVAEFSFLASEGLDVRLTTSIGFASRDSGRQSVTDLLHAADEAMYWVKAHGKNGIHGS